MSRRLLVLVVSVLCAVTSISGPATGAPISPGRSSAADEQVAYPREWSHRTGPEELTLRFAPAEEYPAGTVIDLQLRGCGGTRALASEYSFLTYPMTLQGPLTTEQTFSGTWQVRPDDERRSLGPRWTGVLTVTMPDAASRTFEFDHDTFDFSTSKPLPTNNDTCPGAGPGGNAAVRVQRWSTKTGQKVPAVGRRLTVSRTLAAGATVTYAWKVGARVVDRDRSLRLTRAHRGKVVTIRITVSKTGARTVARTLRYGRVR